MIVEAQKRGWGKGYRLELALFATLAALSTFLTLSLLPATSKRMTLVQPAPVFQRLPGFVEAEFLTVVRTSRPFDLKPQSTVGWAAPGTWSGETHLFAATTLGDFLELELPVASKSTRAITVYLSRAGDYATLRLFVNGKQVIPDFDTGPPGRREGPLVVANAGVHELSGKHDVLRLEVVGKGMRSHAPFYQFAIDGVALTAQREAEKIR